MRPSFHANKGFTYMAVTIYLAVAFIFVSSLLHLLHQSVIQGRNEGVTLEARALAEAGLARALAEYGQLEQVDMTSFGNGYYAFTIHQLSRDQIAITSLGRRHPQSTRLPTVELYTQWTVLPGQEGYRFRLLCREERIGN